MKGKYLIRKVITFNLLTLVIVASSILGVSCVPSREAANMADTTVSLEVETSSEVATEVEETSTTVEQKIGYEWTTVVKTVFANEARLALNKVIGKSMFYDKATLVDCIKNFDSIIADKSKMTAVQQILDSAFVNTDVNDFTGTSYEIALADVYFNLRCDSNAEFVVSDSITVRQFAAILSRAFVAVDSKGKTELTSNTFEDTYGENEINISAEVIEKALEYAKVTSENIDSTLTRKVAKDILNSKALQSCLGASKSEWSGFTSYVEKYVNGVYDSSVASKTYDVESTMKLVLGLARSSYYSAHKVEVETETEKQTEKATEKQTEKQTEAPTQKPTEAPTKAPAKQLLDANGNPTGEALGLTGEALSGYNGMNSSYKAQYVEYLRNGGNQDPTGWIIGCDGSWSGISNGTEKSDEQVQKELKAYLATLTPEQQEAFLKALSTPLQ